MWDVLIQHAQVIDGSGAPSFIADVAIRGDSIAQVGSVASPQARVTIDGTGLTVGPGFIDLHTHSDYTLLVNPLAESKVHQGVTTEVIGNCGTSPAPLGDEAYPIIRARMEQQYQLDVSWRTLGGYLDRLVDIGDCGECRPYRRPWHRPQRRDGLCADGRRRKANWRA